MRCKYCNSKITKDATKCLFCGKEIEKNKSFNINKPKILIVFAILISVSAGEYFYLSTKSANKPNIANSSDTDITNSSDTNMGNTDFDLNADYELGYEPIPLKDYAKKISKYNTMDISSDNKVLLKDMNTSYKDIKWDKEFQLDSMPQIITSFFSLKQDSPNILLYGVTNLNNHTLKGNLKGQLIYKNKTVIKEINIHTSNFDYGNTILNSIELDKKYKPKDITIKWEDISLEESNIKTNNFKCHISIVGNPNLGYVEATLTFKNNSNVQLPISTVNCLLLDKQGYIVAFNTVSKPMIINGNSSGTVFTKVKGKPSELKKCKKVGMFATVGITEGEK